MEIARQQGRATTDWNARLEGLVANPVPLFIGILLVFIVVFGASIFLVPRRYGRLITGEGIYY